MGCTQSLTNHQLDPLSASADARDGSRTSPAGKVRPSFETTASDGARWDAWIDHLRSSAKPELADSAIANGKLTATSRWPKVEEGLQGVLDVGAEPVRELTEKSKAMTGDAACRLFLGATQ